MGGLPSGAQRGTAPACLLLRVLHASERGGLAPQKRPRYADAVSAAATMRLSTDFDALRGFLDSLQSYSQDLVQHLESGAKLCHYTTIEGAVGIITSQDLWLTNARFSNDDEEMRYGQRLLRDVLAKLGLAAPAGLEDQIASTHDDQVYFCCFCEKDNLLSQWRGYADNGGGISIEFDPIGFKSFCGPDCQHGLMRLWAVFYDEPLQRQILESCVKYPYWPASSPEDRARYIAEALQFFMPTFKNPDFREEQERRLIFTPHPKARPSPRFRSRRGLLVPYYSLRELSQQAGVPNPAFRLPIKSLLIGPSPHRELNMQSARLMLDKNGYEHVPVMASPTPYRG